MARMFDGISNAELAAFLRGAATYFSNRDTGGEDMAFWANVANAEKCEIAAERLEASAVSQEQR